MMFKEIPVGSDVEGIEALVEDLKSGITKRNTKYYTVILRDQSADSIKAQVWEESVLPANLSIGDVVKFCGSVSSYQGNKQITIRNMTQATRTKPEDYIKKTSKDVEDMWKHIQNRVSGMKDFFCRHLGTELITSEYLSSLFKKAPAATKVHNNWVGGLIEHVFAMCNLADGICDHYQGYYPNLNKDQVILGCMLHDLGKVFEYENDNPVFPKTPSGVLVNHIVWGPSWVYSQASMLMSAIQKGDFAEDPSININTIRDARDSVMHMVASHHGKIEWGSPVVPATIEAIILHYIDNLDTHAMHAIEAIKKEGNIKGFSERSYVYGTEFRQ